MNPSAALASLVSRTRYEDIPAEVITRAKEVMLDTLSCAVAGYTVAPEECRWIIELVKELEGKPEATVWFDGFKTSVLNAALANATMVHTVDFDDTHLDSVSHLGAGLLGATLALAEKTGATGKEALAAFILGFDVGARAGNSVNGTGRTHYKYWHPTATAGTIAASAAAARLMELNEEEAEQAIGLGVDQAAGFRYCIDKGDFSKSLHPGWAAMRGVMAAMIIKKGANGPKGLLEYETGFCNAMSASPQVGELTKGLGKEYLIMQDAVKLYPTIHCSHTGIEAVLDIVRENDLKKDDIKAINLSITELAKGQGITYNPESVLAARLSIPFCVASAVNRRQVTLGDFTEETLNDPDFREVMNKTFIEPNPEFNKKYPRGLVTRAVVVTKDGKKYEKMHVYPKGHPERPATKDDLLQKYRSLTSLTWPQKKADDVYQAVMELEKLDNIKKLVEMF
ncbi:MAG: MmgE/PrpD family protein [Peptococcaceae bacterium]|jgi:2-methylcitrate dehydratase PrpD|nr:MmgE/PrpD family protein [Peptococcaceae bacterium]MDH7525583.1 MmgE/PrpD family protein [Peptococcaceae bacterium]